VSAVSVSVMSECGQCVSVVSARGECSERAR
jgi:hypothetical protein